MTNKIQIVSRATKPGNVQMSRATWWVVFVATCCCCFCCHFLTSQLSIYQYFVRSFFLSSWLLWQARSFFSDKQTVGIVVALFNSFSAQYRCNWMTPTLSYRHNTLAFSQPYLPVSWSPYSRRLSTNLTIPQPTLSLLCCVLLCSLQSRLYCSCFVSIKNNNNSLPFFLFLSLSV